MGVRESYEESVNRALRRIADHIPEDLVQQFADKSGITQEDIHLISPGPSGMVSAIDGSNAMIAEGGSVSLAAIRAARTTFSGGERYNRSVTPLTLVTIGPGHRNLDFAALYEECFGVPPPQGPRQQRSRAGICHPPRHAGVLGGPADRKNPAGRSPPAHRRCTAGVQPEP